MNKYIFLFFVFFSQLCHSQLFLSEPAPLKPGNYWKYWDHYEYFYFKVLDSTVVLDSNTYYVVETASSIGMRKYYQYNRLDSSNNYYIRYNNGLFCEDQKYYKKNIQMTDEWRNYGYDCGEEYLNYSVIESGQTLFEGKTIDYNLILIKADGGESEGLVEQWQYWTDEFGLLNVLDFEGGSHDLIACVIDGVVYGDTTFTDVTEISNNIPDRFELQQNYPNPFNPTTTIQYQIKVPSFVKLTVYDLLGREVEVLHNGFLNSGTYISTFKGDHLTSGIYICRLQAGDFVASKKMTLLK